jgi:hypothetical protein
MNSSNATPRQPPLRDGEWEWLNRPGRFLVGGVTRDNRIRPSDNRQRKSSGNN